MIKIGEFDTGCLVGIELFEGGKEVDEREFFSPCGGSWSGDLFYSVDGIDYCVEAARMWENGIGEFEFDEKDPGRLALVTPLSYVFQLGNDENGNGDNNIIRTFKSFGEAQVFAKMLNKGLSEDHQHCYIPIDETGEDHF